MKPVVLGIEALRQIVGTICAQAIELPAARVENFEAWKARGIPVAQMAESVATGLQEGWREMAAELRGLSNDVRDLIFALERDTREKPYEPRYIARDKIIPDRVALIKGMMGLT